MERATDEELDALRLHLRTVRTVGTELYGIHLPAAFAKAILARLDFAEAARANVLALHYAASNEEGPLSVSMA